MSLIRCRECGGSVASDADRCPTCGSKSIAEARRWEKLKWKVLGFTVVVILGLVALLLVLPALGLLPKNELPKGPNPSRSIQ